MGEGERDGSCEQRRRRVTLKLRTRVCHAREMCVTGDKAGRRASRYGNSRCAKHRLPRRDLYAIDPASRLSSSSHRHEVCRPPQRRQGQLLQPPSLHCERPRTYRSCLSGSRARQRSDYPALEPLTLADGIYLRGTRFVPVSNRRTRCYSLCCRGARRSPVPKSHLWIRCGTR